MIDDPSLIALFLSDLSVYNDAIKKDLGAFIAKVDNPLNLLSQVMDNFHLLRGNAILIQCESIAESCHEIELALSKFIEKKIVPSEEFIKGLLEVGAYLESVASQSLSTLDKFILSGQESLLSRVSSLKALANKETLASLTRGQDESEGNKEEFKPKELKKIVPVNTLIDDSMVDLFRVELENQLQILNEGLVDYESLRSLPEGLEPLMRAAHSIKGAGRVIGLEIVVKLAHAIEDCFVAGQVKKIVFSEPLLDVLFQGIDVFTRLAKVPALAFDEWAEKQTPEILKIISEIQEYLGSALSDGAKEGSKVWISEKIEKEEKKSKEPIVVETKAESQILPKKETSLQDKVLRVTAENLNKLMGLAGETLVESRWLQPFDDSLIKMKKLFQEMTTSLDLLRDYLNIFNLDERAEGYLLGLQRKIEEGKQYLLDRLVELDLYIVRNSSLSDRLYREVIASRMRPFKDGVEAFPRMVHDLCRTLKKKVRLEVRGKNTTVDRDILEKLEAPLGHLLRNAVDHGIELPEERIFLGKPEEGLILLEAEHKAGMLSITVSDDGRGIDTNRIREKIEEMGLVKKEMIGSLSESELFDFLFLPGFSTSKAVTDISGRGVGLDVVLSMIQQVAGSIRIVQSLGKGTTFYLQLPLTLSVIRALIVEISKEPYAFPLSRIERSLYVARQDLLLIEGQQYFRYEGLNIGLVNASQVLQLEPGAARAELLSVIVVGEGLNYYGVVVDRFIGEKELVVQELERSFGKVQNISAGALMEDGSPLLIIDVEDFARSIDNILYRGALKTIEYGGKTLEKARKKRVLVVDDSITVREVESRLLRNKGYEVETAVNGADGWNAVRIGNYDLLVTDIDMPRMNGIELIRAVRQDLRLKEMPTMIVSYKEREEDRLKGMEAGANYYLTKSSFHDETLLDVVEDLIGPP